MQYQPRSFPNKIITCFKGSPSSPIFRGLKGPGAQWTQGVSRWNITKESLQVLATCTLPSSTLEVQLGFHERNPD